MPSEIGNQSVRSAGGEASNVFITEEAVSQLIVVSFADSAQAEGLYSDLLALNEKGVIRLEDAVFVKKDAKGKYKVDEKFHHEKRTGMLKGAGVGVVVGLIVGGPVLGLVGGAIAGRFIGKHTDLGIDDGTVKSVAEELDSGRTALFVLGATKHVPTVIETFEKYEGKVIQTTVDSDAQAKLQKALEASK